MIMHTNCVHMCNQYSHVWVRVFSSQLTAEFWLEYLGALLFITNLGTPSILLLSYYLMSYKINSVLLKDFEWDEKNKHVIIRES